MNFRITISQQADHSAVRRTVRDLTQWFKNVYAFETVEAGDWKIEVCDPREVDMATLRSEVREITGRCGVNYTLIGEGGAACTP